MLRGLVVRQTFVVFEGILGLIIVGIAILAVRDLYSPSESDGRSDNHVAEATSTVELQNPVSTRSAYQSIIASKIFGNAASYRHNAPKVVPKVVKPVNPIVTDSKLPLKLMGTLAAGEESQFSSANIQINEKGRGVQTFFIGAEIIENVFLKKVFKNEVLLDNQRANREEKLKHVLDTEVKGAPSRVAKASPAELRKEAIRRPTLSGRSQQQKLITLDRKDIVKRMEAEYERLASTVDVLEVKDEDGNLKGISTPEIENIAVLKELGFKNGDILVSVNNEAVTGQDQMASLANKYRNSNVVRVGILRNDQPMNFTYRLK